MVRIEKVCMGVKEAKHVCRMGKGDRQCAFLVFADHFMCAKNTDLEELILQRLEENKLPSKGLGEWKGCYWEPRTSDISAGIWRV